MVRRNWVVLLLGLVGGGLLMWALEAAAQQETADEELFKQYDRFIEVIRHVQDKYVREVNSERLFKDAIKGMLGGLDPFSSYIAEDEVDEFNKATRGKFSGIGIQIGMRKGLLAVISPLEDTPAYREGVLAGDIILEIDGKSTDGMNLNDAVKAITGEPGTKVTLKVRHMTGAIRDITITREVIEIHTVKGHKRTADNKWVWMIDADKKIAYVRVTGFVDNTVEELRVVLDELVKGGTKAMILDLRFNPGGQLKSAIEMVDLFIDKGVIVQTKGRTTPHWESTARAEGTLPRFPMVVLINPFSASASEIVAGALQDHGRAILVGERTFGKGSVQNVIPLAGDKAALKLTTSKYYMPGGRNIHREEDMTDADEWGVVPDIVIPMTPEEHIAVLRARQEADIIQNRDQKKAPAEGAAAPPPPIEDEGLDEEGVEPKGDQGKAPARPEAQGDKQLERSLDILRSLDIIEKYLKGKGA